MSDILKVKVVPNSQKFEICEFNPWDNSLRIKLKSKAEKGKANQELVESLEKLLGSRIRILQGKTSRNKVIEVEGKRIEEVLALLESNSKR